jgi:hypothetical protein
MAMFQQLTVCLALRLWAITAHHDVTLFTDSMPVILIG